MAYAVKHNRRRGEMRYRIVKLGWLRDEEIAHTNDPEFARALAQKLNAEEQRREEQAA